MKKEDQAGPHPTRSLLVKVLRKRGLQIIMQDEYNTSKVCPKRAGT